MVSDSMYDPAEFSDEEEGGNEASVSQNEAPMSEPEPENAPKGETAVSAESTKSAPQKEKKNESEERAVMFRVFAGLFALLSVGGLFAGLLGKWIPFFTHPSFQGGEVLSGSFLGYVLFYFESVFSTIGIGEYLSAGGVASVAVINVLQLLFVCTISLSAVASLVLFIVSLCSRKAAKNCSVVSGVLAVSGYFGLFLLQYCVSAASSPVFSKALFSALDPILGIIGGVAAVLAMTSAIVRRKGRGVLQCVQFVLPLAALFALTYPSFVLGADAFLSLDMVESVPFIGIALFFLTVVMLFDLVASLVRLGAKRAYGFDLARGIVLFLSVVLAIVSFMVQGGMDTWYLFTSDGQLLPTALFLCTALASLIVSVVQFVAGPVKEEAQEESHSEAHAESVAAKATEETENTETSEEAETEEQAEGGNETVEESFEQPAEAFAEESAPLYEAPVYGEEELAPVEEPVEEAVAAETVEEAAEPEAEEEPAPEEEVLPPLFSFADLFADHDVEPEEEEDEAPLEEPSEETAEEAEVPAEEAIEEPVEEAAGESVEEVAEEPVEEAVAAEAAEEAAEPEAEEEPAPEEEPVSAPYYEQPRPYANIYANEGSVPSYASYKQPEPTPSYKQPEPMPSYKQPEPAPAYNAYNQPAPAYPPYASYKQPEPTPSYKQPEPVYNAPYDRYRSPYAQQPVSPENAFSQWEREMAALAAGRTPEPAPEPQQKDYAPRFSAASRQYRQPSYFEGINQYTYDPFINSLTQQEKNEFGDIFIAHKNGRAKNMPVYVIGGDNEEFFRTVWIKYNSFGMSPSLKEKVYLYLTSKD